MQVYFRVRVFLNSHYSFSMLPIRSAFPLSSFRSRILFPKLFVAFFASGCGYVFVNSSPTCRWNFLSFFFLNVLFCLYCLIMSQYYFSLPSFATTFRFITSSRIVCFTCCVAILLSSQQITAFFLFLYFFACCRWFHISVFSLIFHVDFDFLFVFFRGTPILSQPNFTPA